jgi:hypothetical protein
MTRAKGTLRRRFDREEALRDATAGAALRPNEKNK